MEMDPVSEWGAGLSEFLAVCVALFLPYYHKRKKEQRKVRNLKTAIKKLGAEVIAGDQDATKVLNIYLVVSFLSDTNADIEALVIQGRELLDQIKKLPAKTDGTYDEAMTKAKLLLNQIS
ncbi:hypothetical protein J9325_07280 [Lacticaseibacillus paracasei]|uniref:hypothetical protein n=1 Tax=Lacticaseibacillus paracasei TaxID=1597 RepID=UPI001B398DFF|nr:hypothetical protein [Lacticaseibacillus paracasei]QTX17063.1 hypothetical protein J9325_07280 [Lacticaseibacillus paracasei]